MRVISLVTMSDPTISNQSRPIYKEESIHFGRMNLNEYNFNFGVFFTDFKDNHIPIPREVGRIVSQERLGDDDIVPGSQRETIPCNSTAVFQKVNQELTELSENSKEYGYCVDPAHGTIAGVETFGTQTIAEVTFQPCWNITDRDYECYDKYQLREWSDSYRGVKLNYISTFAWIDLYERTDYLKETLTQETIGNLDYLTFSKAKIKLELHEVDMQDDLWNPFQAGIVPFFFLDTKEGGIEEIERKEDE